MENNPTVSKVSVALSDIEKKIIEDLRKKQGSNFSSALRVIVREWDEIKNSGSAVDKLPFPTPTKKNEKRPEAVAA